MICSMVSSFISLIAMALILIFPFNDEIVNTIVHAKTFLVSQLLNIEPNLRQDMKQIVLSKGYAIEKHDIVTEDGYILGVFRMPHRKGVYGPLKTKKPVVVLQHALLDSSFSYVLNSEENSLAYILADKGYDVWLPNNRGNKWSTRHVSLSTDSKEFWDFTWDEMAKYDIPAEIDYILNTTSSESVAYVGHSQGSIQMFGALSESHILSKKISLFIALGPVAQVSNMQSYVLRFAEMIKIVKIFDWFGWVDFMRPSKMFTYVFPDVCELIPGVCNLAIETICGRTKNINISLIPKYITYTPSGTSMKNMKKWFHSMRNDGMQKYDYGCQSDDNCENSNYYNGSKTPPNYNLTNIDVPMALFYGSEDLLSNPQDIEDFLIPNLRPSQLIFTKKIEGYAHIDFTWAYNANVKVYNEAVELIEQYKS